MKRRSTEKKIIYCFIAMVFAAAISGCTTAIGISSNNDRNSYSLLNRPDDLMPLTSNVLSNYSLYRDYRREPHSVLTKLEKIFFTDPRSDYLAALADVSSKIGQRYKSQPDIAARYHLSALLYSYCYLALEDPAEQKYNPNIVLMLRIYNCSLTELFCYLKDKSLLNKSNYELATASGQKITFKKPHTITALQVDKINRVMLCADYENKNLTNNSRRFGIGVPLIAEVDNSIFSDGSRFAENQTFPLTAVLAFDNAKDSTFATCDAQLIFVDPRERDSIKLSNREIPLEYDYSTPIAYMADKPLKFNNIIYTLHPEKVFTQEGLYYFEPVNPNKIPVVLVHGLMSDTKTWMQMLNTLISDPDIRKHYQFWGVSYSSGNPIFRSAHLMRNALSAEREKLVKNGLSTEKFDRMVLVGHSMGGLISRLATSRSSLEIFFEQIQKNNHSENALNKLDKQYKNEIKKFIEFEPLNFVKRVIYISVPHKGAALASTSLGKLGSRCIQLPANAIKRQHEILEHMLKNGTIKNIPPVFTGIDNLAPDDFAIKLLNKLEMNPVIPYHSIIGNEDGYGIPGGSDGIVPYSSSHIDNVESELVVKSGHSTQQNPIAIQELRRILLTHLKQYSDSELSKPLELKVTRISGLDDETNNNPKKE